MKEFFLTLSIQIVQLTGGLVVFKVLTSRLSSAEFGLYTLILAISALVLVFPFTPIQQALTKFTSTAYKKRTLEIYVTVLVMDTVFFTVYILLLFVSTVFDLFEMERITTSALIALYLATEILKVNNYTYQNALRNKKRYFYAILIEFIIKGSLLTAFVVHVEFVLIVFIIANVCSIVVSLPRQLLAFSMHKVRLYYWSKLIISFSYPLVLWGVFGWLRDMSNRVIIEDILSLEHVAIFAVLNSLAVFVPGALQAFFGMYFMPILYQKEKAQKNSIRIFIRKMILVGIGLITIGTIVIEFLSNHIVELLSDSKYVEYSWMLAPMFFVFSLFLLSMSSTAEIFAYNKTKLLLMPNILSGIISVVAFIMLVKYYGLTGALFAFMLTYVSYAIMTFLVIHRFKI